MTEELTGPATELDLIAAIEGTTHPEAEVKFLFDERAANTIAAIDRELQKHLALGKTDEYEALEKVYFKAIEDLKPALHTVTVKSATRKVKKAILAKVEAEFPTKKTALGQIDDSNALEQLERYQILTWQSRIVKWESPSGEVLIGPLDEATIAKLIDEAPEASVAAVADAIEELDNGSKAGYEQAIRNLDFS